MDYDDGADIDNSLLFWFTLFGMLASILGMVLAYFRVFRKTDEALTAPAGNDSHTVGVAP